MYSMLGAERDCALIATQSVFDGRSISPEAASIARQIGPCYR
jgi:hypothetical protein